MELQSYAGQAMTCTTETNHSQASCVVLGNSSATATKVTLSKLGGGTNLEFRDMVQISGAGQGLLTQARQTYKTREGETFKQIMWGLDPRQPDRDVITFTLVDAAVAECWDIDVPKHECMQINCTSCKDCFVSREVCNAACKRFSPTVDMRACTEIRCDECGQKSNCYTARADCEATLTRTYKFDSATNKCTTVACDVGPTDPNCYGSMGDCLGANPGATTTFVWSNGTCPSRVCETTTNCYSTETACKTANTGFARNTSGACVSANCGLAQGQGQCYQTMEDCNAVPVVENCEKNTDCTRKGDVCKEGVCTEKNSSWVIWLVVGLVIAAALCLLAFAWKMHKRKLDGAASSVNQSTGYEHAAGADEDATMRSFE